MIAEAATAASNWPSDSVWLALVGILAMIVKEVIDRTRNAMTATKVEEVVTTLAEQDRKAEKQEVKFDTLVKQTDGLLKAALEATAGKSELEGAEQQRLRQLEIDAAVIVAKGLSTPVATAPMPVAIVQNDPVKVTETSGK